MTGYLKKKSTQCSDPAKTDPEPWRAVRKAQTVTHFFVCSPIFCDINTLDETLDLLHVILK